MNHRPVVGFLLVAALAFAPAVPVLAQGVDTPPSTPAEVRARAYGPTSGGVVWRRSSDDRSVRGYEISRDGVLLDVRDALSYIDRDLEPARGYGYAIVAIDTAGQRSGRATIRLETPDARPNPPAELTANVYSPTAIGLSWQRSNAVGERYEIRRDGVLVATTGGTSHIDTALSDRDAPYLFEVIALNRQGERSRSARLWVSGEDRASTGSIRAPAPPTGLRAVAYSATAAGVAWERSTVPGRRYEVRRDGQVVATGYATSYVDTDLAGGRTYDYEVVALENQDRQRSTPAQVRLSTPGSEPPPASAISAISVDNHVELLAHLFDIYTGNAWGPALVALPDYSALPDIPAGPASQRPFSVAATCENGGTVDFDRVRFGDFTITTGWVYDFDDCQDGGDVLQGRLSAAGTGSNLLVSSPGFTLSGPVGRTRFRGNVDWVYAGLRTSSDLRSWTTTTEAPYFAPNAHDRSGDGVDFVLTDADENVTFELLGARTSFSHRLPRSKSLVGSFSIRSQATGGARLTVTTPERFYHDGQAILATPPFVAAEHPDFETGVLRVSAENGDTILVDAATGDRDTLRVEITVDGLAETLMQPWSLWREHLEFDEAFLGGP